MLVKETLGMLGTALPGGNMLMVLAGIYVLGTHTI